METKTSMFADRFLLTGILLIILSTFIFMLPEMNLIHPGSNSDFGIFFFCYSIAIGYMIAMMVRGFMKFKWKVFTASLNYMTCLHILLLISAFALNRELPIFEKSVPWVCTALAFLCITLLMLTLRHNLPAFLQHVLFFLNGAGFVMLVYFAIYLLPYYGIGFVASFFFGISLHVFAPLFLILSSLLHFTKAFKENKSFIYTFLGGICLALIIAAGFIIQWDKANKKINYILNDHIVNESDLPAWVNLSRQLPKNAFMEKVIKAGLVYSTPDKNSGNFWRMPQGSFDESRKHDPLVMTSALLAGTPDFTRKERISILESMYDSRHHAQERLWSGDMLETANVISNVRIYPDYRMAYTEKILSIRNNGMKDRWRPAQEAIYTFHLPEGGVISSLSLWIEGKEEKGIMTTKSKADSAYKTIVGVEKRDPSVVHWQEGNTVSVRVFPCTPEENRRFKVGITSPLRKEGNSLIYENIHFKGPDAGKATESVQVNFTMKPGNPDMPAGFTASAEHTFKTEKKYEPDWNISLDAVPVSTQGFSFNGKSYLVEDYKKKYESFSPSAIYLDINNSWSQQEFDEVWKAAGKHKVYVSDGDMILLDDANRQEVFSKLASHNFSLFPLHKITDPSHALLVTKSTAVSPNLGDIKESAFSSALIAGLKAHEEIKMFSLVPQLSPYLKTLKELRYFRYDEGNPARLDSLLKNGKFISQQEDSSAIVLDISQTRMVESSGMVSTGGPDHLMRLFAYNDIMKKVSRQYFNPEASNEEAIAEALEAYVVSPVSSLIVLETQKDYDRFNITESKNSLQNASMKSAGAVPEPHEWMLIILSLAAVSFLLLRSRPGQ